MLNWGDIIEYVRNNTVHLIDIFLGCVAHFCSECFDVYFLDVAKRKRPFFEFFRFDAQLTGDQLMVGHRVGLVDPNIRKTVRGAWGDEEVE